MTPPVLVAVNLLAVLLTLGLAGHRAQVGWPLIGGLPQYVGRCSRPASTPAAASWFWRSTTSAGARSLDGLDGPLLARCVAC